MKRESILVLATVVLLVGSVFAGDYSGGDGSVENPYRIATAADMNEIGANSDDWDAHFVMVNDVNLSDYTGTQFNIIGTDEVNVFSGVFDGNGHTIYNFTYESTDGDYIGLFGYVDHEDAEIKDLTLIDPNVDTGTGEYVGVLVGQLEKGIVTGCSVEGGRVEGYRYVGGLAGYNSIGMIEKCFASARVVGGVGRIGGLVGRNGEIIQNCGATGTVSGPSEVGGLVGANWDRIYKSFATGYIQSHSYVGGLVGLNYAEIKNCYATGYADGTNRVGGLVGWQPDWGINDKVINCYAVGTVTGVSDVGALVGYDAAGTPYTSCFWNTDINPSLTGAGNVSPDPEGIIGETTANMLKLSTYTDAGWDFVEIWNIGENQTYPYLRVYPAGDLNHDGRVDMLDLAIFASHWLEGTEP